MHLEHRVNLLAGDVRGGLVERVRAKISTEQARCRTACTNSRTHNSPPTFQHASTSSSIKFDLLERGNLCLWYDPTQPSPPTAHLSAANDSRRSNVSVALAVSHCSSEACPRRCSIYMGCNAERWGQCTGDDGRSSGRKYHGPGVGLVITQPLSSSRVCGFGTLQLSTPKGLPSCLFLPVPKAFNAPVLLSKELQVAQKP